MRYFTKLSRSACLIFSTVYILFDFCIAAMAQNMVVNGDFEAGYTGFTSDYTDYTGKIDRSGSCPGYGNPCTMERGQFAVGTNAKDYNVPFFRSLADKTTGSGKYFIADADTDTSEAPWISQRTIVISSTTKTYRFAAYIVNVNGDNAPDLPNLSFQIGDGTSWVTIGSTGPIDNNLSWQLFEQNMKFSNTGLFYIRLLNSSDKPIGNDLGLDDVSFTECASCTATQTVNIGALESPGLKGVKTAVVTGGTAAIEVGDVVTYTITAANTGNVTLTEVLVDSDTLTRADGTVLSLTSSPSFVSNSGTSPQGTLAPGETATFKASYTLLQADIDAGGVSNTATVRGTPPFGPAITDVTDDGDDTDGNTADDTTDIIVTVSDIFDMKRDNLRNVIRRIEKAKLMASLTGNEDMVAEARNRLMENAAACSRTEGDLRLVVTGNPIDDDGIWGINPGDRIEYTIIVRNVGKMPVSSITLSGRNMTVRGGPLSVLPPGGEDGSTFTAIRTISEEDVNSGSVEASAVVVGYAGDGSREVRDVSGTSLRNDDPTRVSLHAGLAMAYVEAPVTDDLNEAEPTFCSDPSTPSESVTSANGAVPFDVNGQFEATGDANGLSVAGNGTFSGQTGFLDGVNYRLSGSFDVVSDGNLGLQASLDARVMREQLVSKGLLLGVFAGASYTSTDIQDSYGFDGDHSGATVFGGGYLVSELSYNLYLDAFAALGYGYNNLSLRSEIGDDNSLDVDGDYDIVSWQVGGSLTGVVSFGDLGFFPNLAVSYGNSDIGEGQLTSKVFGSESNETLSSDFIEIAVMRFTPELRFSLTGEAARDSNSYLSIRPSTVCLYGHGEDPDYECGGGIGLGLSNSRENGSVYVFDFAYENIAGTTAYRGQASFTWRF